MRWVLHTVDFKRPQFRLEDRHIPWLVLIIVLLVLGSHAREIAETISYVAYRIRGNFGY